jgi:hypothetical protein
MFETFCFLLENLALWAPCIRPELINTHENR